MKIKSKCSHCGNTNHFDTHYNHIEKLYHNKEIKLHCPYCNVANHFNYSDVEKIVKDSEDTEKLKIFEEIRKDNLAFEERLRKDDQLELVRGNRKTIFLFIIILTVLIVSALFIGNFVNDDLKQDNSLFKQMVETINSGDSIRETNFIEVSHEGVETTIKNNYQRNITLDITYTRNSGVLGHKTRHYVIDIEKLESYVIKDIDFKSCKLAGCWISDFEYVLVR